MRFSNKYFWYVLDLILFLGINIFLLWKFQTRFSQFSISWLEVLILGLAVYRAANVISNEQLTKPLREPFVEEKVKDGKKIEVPKQKGFNGAMGSLLYCPSCTGTWIAMILVYSYIFWPEPTKLIALILALSGIERLFTSLVGYFKK